MQLAQLLALYYIIYHFIINVYFNIVTRWDQANSDYLIYNNQSHVVNQFYILDKGSSEK